MSHRRGLRSRRVALACHALAASLTWLVATATAAEVAAPNGLQRNVPLVCLLPREDPSAGPQLLPQAGNYSAATTPYEAQVADRPMPPSICILDPDLAVFALTCDADLAEGSELMPIIPHWAAQFDAERVRVANATCNFEAYLARSRGLLLEPPAPGESCEFAVDCRVIRPSPQVWDMPRYVDLLGRPMPAIAEPSENLLLMTSRRARPATPSGTAYLWSFVASTAEATDHSETGARAASGPAAGLVLTRPPGLYSIDWIGVAITAPLH